LQQFLLNEQPKGEKMDEQQLQFDLKFDDEQEDE